MLQNRLKIELDGKSEYQELLFQRGFLITDFALSNLEDYPFYGNWFCKTLGGYNFVINKNVSLYYKEHNGTYLFLIGHAYNPFEMEANENEIIEKLAMLSGMEFWKYEADLTGIYVMGRITPDGEIIHWSDCAGMRISYYGHVKSNYFITSHVNLVAALCELTEDQYITSLKKSRYFYLFGNVLPADYSVYSELKRTVPNHTYSGIGSIKRFYPIERIEVCRDETEYQNTLSVSAEVLRNTLALCAQKWKDRKIAISVTGGKDSGETLASANGNYGTFSYFSYISKPEEAVDAYAAADICKELGLPHEIWYIPQGNESIEDFDLINEIIYVNGGNIGYIKPNEVRKRSYLIHSVPIDVEIKSWVNETVRAYWYKKYAKTSFPKKPTGRYLAALYKVFLENRILYHKTGKVFDEYINKYMRDSYIELLGDWTTLWSWEFGFSAGEGQSLFAEHMLSFDITIPFNNRHLISLMLSPKLQDRIDDRLQKDIIKTNNPKQAALNISVVNAAHTNKRAMMEKAYLFINTHLPF